MSNATLWLNSSYAELDVGLGGMSNTVTILPNGTVNGMGIGKLTVGYPNNSTYGTGATPQS